MSALTEGERPRSLIYIGGYGRSGSTLLGRVLAENPAVLDLGEVARAGEFLPQPRWVCGCGRTWHDCPVWAQVEPGLLGHGEGDLAAHLARLEAVATAFPQYSVLVDSSKTAHRQRRTPGFLARQSTLTVTFVHLIRDPRAVAWSLLRDKVRRRETPPFWKQAAITAKVALAWIVANIAAERFARRHRGASVRLRYDRMLAEGVPALLQPFIAAGPLNGRVLGIEGQNTHAASGNPRVRKRTAITIAPDEDWRDHLNGFLGTIVLLISLPFMARYGFLGRRSNPQMATV